MFIVSSFCNESEYFEVWSTELDDLLVLSFDESYEFTIFLNIRL